LEYQSLILGSLTERLTQGGHDIFSQHLTQHFSKSDSNRIFGFQAFGLSVSIPHSTLQFVVCKVVCES